MSLFLSLSLSHIQITSMLHSQIYFHTFAPAYCILPFSLTLSLPHTHAHTLPSISTSLSPSHTFPAYHTHTHPISFSIFHASIFPISISISLSLPRMHASLPLSLSFFLTINFPLHHLLGPFPLSRDHDPLRDVINDVTAPEMALTWTMGAAEEKLSLHKLSCTRLNETNFTLHSK